MRSKIFIFAAYFGSFCILTGVSTPGLNFNAVQRCSDPFYFVAGKCYWFYRPVHMSAVNRKQALSQCQAADARLAQVQTAVKHAKLRNWIHNHEFRLMSYWIDLSSDNSGKREFRWHGTNDEAAFTEWGEGQPTPRPYRTCVTMSANFSHSWEAVNCGQRNLFICEKEPKSSEQGQWKAASVLSLNRFCHSRSLGYYADPTDCTNYILCFGTSLSIFSCPNNEIFNPANSMCGAKGRETLCETTPDATTTTFPITDGTDYSEYYEDEYEIDKSPIGCEANDTDDEEFEKYPDFTCNDPRYSKLGKKCYRIFYERPVVWSAANEICIGDEGGRLATIKSKRTQEYLYNKLKQRNDTIISDYWIGLNNQKTFDTYVWSDESTLDCGCYENWSRKAKKRHRHLKKCVHMALLLKGHWEDSACANENGYICEKAAVNLAMDEDGHRLSEPVNTFGWKSPNSLCGTNRRHNLPEAVVGGRTADVAEHPWQASLRSFGEHRCGGTLIDNCWVLTAAHCVDIRATGHSKLPSLVVLGDVDTSVLEGTEKYLRIWKIILHPQWTFKPVPTHDIALLKLGICVDDLNPICLPGKEFDIFSENKLCKVAGWGTMDTAMQDYPSRLQEADLPLLSQSLCEKKYMLKRKSLIQDSMFCAGYLRGGIDACQGDSGGPLACKGIKSANQAVQWGIVSWGFGCAGRDRPGVYTKVAHYMDWIRNQTMIDF